VNRLKVPRLECVVEIFVMSVGKPCCEIPSSVCISEALEMREFGVVVGG